MKGLNFEKALATRLRRACANSQILEVLEWAVLPPGKLFRPRLLETLSADLATQAPQDILHLALALELHHAYSLVHDDMPCMDNDPIRRGKASTHAQFGEWQALLAGDALLALSYAELEHLAHPQAASIRRFFHWATGPKGLILGQWIDLSTTGRRSPGAIVRMHELKTARLMQIATVSANILANQPLTFKAALRLGTSIGVTFQLLDDLDDALAPNVASHEQLVNPFLLDPILSLSTLERTLAWLMSSWQKLPMTRAFLERFLQQSAQEVLSRQTLMSERLPSIQAQTQRLLKTFV